MTDEDRTAVGKVGTKERSARRLVSPACKTTQGERVMAEKAKTSETGERKKARDEKLDRELEHSFPASDPPSSIQPGTRSGAPDRSRKTPASAKKSARR